MQGGLAISVLQARLRPCCQPAQRPLTRPPYLPTNCPGKTLLTDSWVATERTLVPGPVFASCPSQDVRVSVPRATLVLNHSGKSRRPAFCTRLSCKLELPHSRAGWCGLFPR